MTEAEIDLTFDGSVKTIYMRQLTKFSSTGASIMNEWDASVTIQVRNVLPSGIVVKSI